MTYGLCSSDVRAILATCSGCEVVEPGARAKTSVLDAIGCHGHDNYTITDNQCYKIIVMICTAFLVVNTTLHFLINT